MSENPIPNLRMHAEAPAEGDLDADATDLRLHSQDPAEGADTEVFAPQKAGTPKPPAV